MVLTIDAPEEEQEFIDKQNKENDNLDGVPIRIPNIQHLT